MFGKVLWVLGRIYLFIAFLFIGFNYVVIWYNSGFGAVADLLNPWNIWNFGLTILILSPGIIMIVISKRDSFR